MKNEKYKTKRVGCFTIIPFFYGRKEQIGISTKLNKRIIDYSELY